MRRLIGAIVLAFLTQTAAAAVDRTPPRKPRLRSIRVTATAYCRSGPTRSGMRARTGMIAADPRVLPVGSVVKILDGPTTGTYTVMDTGGDIRGRRIDVYMPSCARAKRFGRRTLRIQVVRAEPGATEQ